MACTRPVGKLRVIPVPSDERTHYYGDDCNPPHLPPRPTREEHDRQRYGGQGMPGGGTAYAVATEHIKKEALLESDQKKRFIDALRKMREMEDKASEHYYKYLQRKEEIGLDIEREYRKRDTLGHTKEHLIDERVSKDVAASSAAANNKWYISQATMYALMAQMELEALKLKLYTPR
jgi:hypothetical protein